MRYGLFLVALLMLIYVLASFLGSGYIGIIYFPALAVSSGQMSACYMPMKVELMFPQRNNLRAKA